MSENYTMICWEREPMPCGGRAYFASIEIAGKLYEYTCRISSEWLQDDRRMCARMLVRARRNARRERDRLEREHGPIRANLSKITINLSAFDPSLLTASDLPKPMQFTDLLKSLLIEERKHTPEDAARLMADNPSIVVEGIMRGNFALRPVAMALEMAGFR